MVRAHHPCGPGSNPGVDAICGLSLLLVLPLAPRGFSPGTTFFRPLLKNQHVSTSSYELKLVLRGLSNYNLQFYKYNDGIRHLNSF